MSSCAGRCRDSITWRMFCRIALDGSVPHPTTLMKLTTRCGPAAVDGLNEALLAKAVEAKLLRTNRLRADTTVVPANVAYPTDSGLLGKAVRRIAATGERIQAAGGAVRTRVRDRSRAAGKRAHAIASKLRSRAALGRDEAKAAVLTSTGELAGLAETAARDAQRLLANAKRAVRRAKAKAAELRARGEHDAAAGRRRGRLVRAVNDLAKLLDATRQIVAQTRQRLAGTTPTAPPGGSACTTAMPARSPRAAWANRSSSATRPRSSTTTTGSCSITPSRWATRPTPRNWRPRSKRVINRDRAQTAHRHRRPRLRRSNVDDDAARPGREHVVIPRKGKPVPGPASRRTPARVPTNNQVAHRK